MKILGVIPARYQSSRFPGKPLADLCGRPMIWWVYQQCARVKEINDLLVATDDPRILDVCHCLGMRAALTSSAHLTGTDRVGEAVKDASADLILNIQGDEPLLEPETIRAVLTPFSEKSGPPVCNLMTTIRNPVDAVNCTVPKVIVNRDNMGVYLTRAAAPYPKGGLDYAFYKQVCVYAFRPKALEFFCREGREHGRGRVEKIEDIEVLRFIENGWRVQFVEVQTDSVAVDTPADLERVRRILTEKIQRGEMTAP